MSALKREGAGLESLLREANLSLLHYLQNPDFQKYLIPEPNPHSLPLPLSHSAAVDTVLHRLSFFDQIDDLALDSSIESKIANLKETQFTQKRRDDFFKKHKKDQEEKLASKKKAIERTYNLRDSTLRDSAPKLLRSEFVIHDKKQNKTETFPVSPGDMEGLRPDTDLNDTIISNYIKLMQFVFLPPATEQMSHIFSSFFLEKLISEILKEDMVADKEPAVLVEMARDRVHENYKNVKRWTKKIDIFEKELLIVPINAFKHWFTVFVLRPHALLHPSPPSHGLLFPPHAPRCEIAYCDSMMEQKEFIVEAVRKYLQHELEEKKGVRIELNQSNLPCYQLLLPRQTNTHDCGLYMLTYIEELLMHPHELQDIHLIKHRRKLHLFPRTLILTKRERLRNLFTRLINSKDDEEKNEILAEYKGHRDSIMKDADESDYDTINEREYRKYEKIQLPSIPGNNEQERKFVCEIKFYLDPDVNYYEKDK